MSFKLKRGSTDLSVVAMFANSSTAHRKESVISLRPGISRDSPTSYPALCRMTAASGATDDALDMLTVVDWNAEHGNIAPSESARAVGDQEAIHPDADERRQ